MGTAEGSATKRGRGRGGRPNRWGLPGGPGGPDAAADPLTGLPAAANPGPGEPATQHVEPRWTGSAPVPTPGGSAEQRPARTLDLPAGELAALDQPGPAEPAPVRAPGPP